MDEKVQYLTDKQVAIIIGRSVQTLRNERVKGKGIPWVKLGSSKRSSVRYALKDVLG
jgi:3-deoxy-D-manno-octulosonate 8-phosphate phosphatase KdsC-like HAD superfamily phosphatase